MQENMNGISSDLEKIKSLKIIIGALMGGATIFALITFSQVMTATSAVESKTQEPLTIFGFPGMEATGIVVILSILVNIVASKVQTSITKSTLQQGVGTLAAIQTGVIARMAMAEFIALFGIVALFTCIPYAPLPTYAWALYFPLLLLYEAGIQNFPTEAKIANKIKELESP